MPTAGLFFDCPSCGVREATAGGAALARVRRSGLCQGCRARRTLAERPHLLPLFVGFWRATGFPASSSWLDAAPAEPLALAPTLRAEAAAASPARH